ncbi:MAG: redoxin domain-containing protein [Bryobacteraceae bacterium]|jgi:peroxiredoxin
MYALLLFAFLQAAAPAREPLRSGCSPDAGQLSTVGPNDRVEVLLSVAGWDAPCYKVTVSRADGNLTGYVLGNSLPAIAQFQRQREKASVAAAEADARRALEQAAAARKPADAEPESPKDPAVSTQFKDFSGRDRHGKPFSLSGLKGRATLVTFWSPTEARSQTDLMRERPLYSQFHKNGLEAVGISMDPRANRIDVALDDRSPEWPQMPDQSGLAEQYHVDPRAGKTFLLDASHRVVAAGVMGPEMEKAIRQLLTAP